MILEDIVESTKERVETNKKRHSIYELKEKAFAMPIPRGCRPVSGWSFWTGSG